MAVSGLANLAEVLLNQAAAQEPSANSGITAARTIAAGSTTAKSVARAEAKPAAPLDQFVRSSQTGAANGAAEAVGFFTAPQSSLFTPATEAFLAQSATLGVNATPAASLPAPGTIGVEKQLQALNNSLTALGLSAADIRRVDRIASIINNFDPTSFTSLVYQLVGLAANAAQQTAANVGAGRSVAAATPAATGGSAENTNTAAVADSTGVKFALQGLQLQLTFANNNGQTGQAQSVAVTANLTSAQARAATA